MLSTKLTPFKVLLAGLFVVIAAPMLSAQEMPAGKGKDTLNRVCTACHDIESIPHLRYSRSEWSALVYSMKDMGADGTNAEMEEIVDYLTKNFGKGGAAPATAKTNVNKATAKDIETGLGVTTKEAESIVAYRTKNGDYKDLAGLKKAEGVDAAKIDAAKDKIEF